MSTAKNTVIVALALGSGVLVAIVWRQQNQLQRLSAELRARETNSAGTMAIRNAALRRIAVPPATARVTPVDHTTSEMTFAGAAQAVPANPPHAARRGVSALVRLMENPEFVQALTLQRQATLDARFAELFRRLNLEGQPLADFKRLLAEKENVALDVVTVSETGPQGPLAPETMRASVRAAQTQIEQAIHSSLGNDRYAVYREYEQTLAHRATVGHLEQRLSYTRTPLTPAQADAVVRILAATTTPPAESAPQPSSVLVRAGVPEAVPILPTSAATGRVTEEVVAQAQAVLMPAQLDALREIQVEQQAAMKAAQMIRDVAPAVTEIVPVWPTLMLH